MKIKARVRNDNAVPFNFSGMHVAPGATADINEACMSDIDKYKHVMQWLTVVPDEPKPKPKQEPKTESKLSQKPPAPRVFGKKSSSRK